MLLLVALTVWRFYFATPPPRVVLVHGDTMGTTYAVKVVAKTRDRQSDEAREQLRVLVQGELDAVDAAMTTYDPDSELSQFNDGPAEVDVPLSAETIEVLAIARDVAAQTEGALDITVGPLVERWGFGAAGELQELPSDDELAALRSHVGLGRVRIDERTRTLRKDHAETRVDLSAVAKGYAVDRVVAALKEHGYTDGMVEVGGEVRAFGQTETEKPWRLAIERPIESERSIYEVLPLRDQAMATSGDYRNFSVVDGQRYSHSIDPRTGRPITHKLASVTVVAEDCAHADAWATALNVLGPERGPEIAAAHRVAALFLIADGEELAEVSTTAYDALREAD